MFLQAEYRPTSKASLTRNLFYRKTSSKSYPPHKFDEGFMMKCPQDYVIKPNESRKIDLQLMIKLPIHHIGQVMTPPLESDLLVKPFTISARLSKIKIELTNTAEKAIYCRRGKSVAFLICMKCEEISGCIELRCGFLNFKKRW